MPRPSSLSGFSISELEKVVRQRRGRLGTLEKRRTKLARQLESLEAEIDSLGGITAKRGKRVRNEHSLAESLVSVLKKNGEPMKVAEIVDAVLASGHRTSSPNFRSIVNQALIKDKQFSKGKLRGYYTVRGA
jgi:predicted TIM-barrel enzyme